MLNILRAGSKRTKTIWWILIVITVITFLGGFVFLLGSGLGGSNGARVAGAVGSVNGDPVTRTDFTTALAEQRQNYKQQYGSEAADRDLKMLEVQTWRSLVYQRLMAQQAKHAGLQATDGEVVLSLKTQPPTMLQSAAGFQTNGQFDYAKYQAALKDPNVNWSPFEDMIRTQLPTRKLQERLISSLKVSEPELLDAYKQRYDKVDATIVQIPPDMAAAPKVAEADLQRAYDKYKSRFMAAAHTELEVLMVQKKYGDSEIRTAKELADGLTHRARGGEDFTALARDYSEGPGSDKGGVIDRVFKMSDFDPVIGGRIAALAPGQIADPFQDASRFVIIRRLPPDSASGPTGIRIAQIVVRVRASDDELRVQADKLKALLTEAKRSGLGKAAASAGLATSTTGAYDANNTPPQLYAVPEAADWGLNAKLKDLSPVFEGPDEFVIAQVTRQSPAGLASRSEVEQQLHQLAELDARLAASKPKADAIAAALKQGRTLEEAAAAAGVQPFPITGTTRATPDPRLQNAPEVLGALFGARAGQVIGPTETVAGWYFARVTRQTLAEPAAFVAARSQLMSEILERRQRQFLSSYLAELRGKSKVEDMRLDSVN